jgi:hypothetical protein
MQTMKVREVLKLLADVAGTLSRHAAAIASSSIRRDLAGSLSPGSPVRIWPRAP